VRVRPLLANQEEGGVDDGISGCAGEECSLFRYTDEASIADATCWIIVTTLPAALAALRARSWSSGLLAPPVGPSEPITLRTIRVNAPLTTTHAGQLCLQARFQRLGALFIEICYWFHSFLMFEKPGARL
jgi:hypothetical protein